MMQRFKIGDKVRLSSEALENECYRSIQDKVLTVMHVARRYMPAKEFFARGKPDGYHPGFDASANCALYDLEGANVSLYDWELERS